MPIVASPRRPVRQQHERSRRIVLPVPRPVRALVPLILMVALVPTSPAAAAPATPGGVGVRVHAASIGERTVAGGLNDPAAFTFSPSGRIFYGERFTGEIHIFTRKTGADHLFFTIPNVVTNGEQGLLGLALHPGFPSNPMVYAYATRNVNGQLRDQIVRIKDINGHGSNMTVIFSSQTTSGSYHDGGHIAFGPGGRLYALQGEAHDSSNAQNLRNSAGKILRMTGSGAAAPGNPFIDSSTKNRRIWAFGIRNSFGFTFDPQTGKLWETENGPSCNDELNRIVKGGNFGWGPSEDCGSGTSPFNTNNSGPKPRILPKRWYTPTIAPTGTAFCAGCGLGKASKGRLFFGAYNTGQVFRVTLTSNRLGVASQSVVHTHSGGIESMQAGPGGGLYFSDPNGIYKLVLK
jgi:aldose sugar dehydrogenase